MRQLRVEKPALKALKKLMKSSPNMAKRVKDRISIIQRDGATPQYIALQNIAPLSYRSRIGDYRIVYFISDNELQILKFGHRKDVYRHLN